MEQRLCLGPVAVCVHISEASGLETGADREGFPASAK
jgi:hypothetical protein